MPLIHEISVLPAKLKILCFRQLFYILLHLTGCMTDRTIFSEEILAAWCSRSDRKSQKYMYETYAGPMFRLLLRYAGNETDAQDILVVGFTKVLKNIGDFKFRGKGSLGAWIRKIMVNEALMFLRAKKNIGLVDEDGYLDVAGDSDPVSDLGAEEIYNKCKSYRIPA